MQSPLHYGLAVLIGAGGYLYWRRWLGRYELAPGAIPTAVLLGLLLMILGGHAAYFVVDGAPLATGWDFFLTLNGWRAGYRSGGVLLGGVLALLLTALIHRVRTLYLLDLAAPAIFIVSALWRVGCFFHGCCYGLPTALPWGVRFVRAGELGLLTPPSHPVQFYEVGASLALFVLLPLLARRLGTRPGEGLLALTCLMLYAFERFLLDFLRLGVSSSVAYLGLSGTQWTALVLMVLSLCVAVIVIGKRGWQSHTRKQ